MKKILLLSMLCSLMCISFAANSNKNDSLLLKKSVFFFDNPILVNLWSQSLNPAGYHFYKINNISQVQGRWSHEEKNLRWAQAPGKTKSYSFHTNGIKKINRLTIKGSFQYKSEHYDELFFNNTMLFDNQNIYSTADTIGGKQKNEGYLMGAGIALPLFPNLIVGVDLDYSASVGGKMQDPRNLNTQSKLNILSGVIYQNNNNSIGFSGGPIWANNHISISTMHADRHSLFHMLGMGYYNLSRNISSDSYRYENNGFQVAAQYSLIKNTWETIHRIHYVYSSLDVLEGTSFRLLAGNTHRNKIEYQGNILYFGNNYIHQVDISFNAMLLNGTEIKQETYPVREGNITWYEVRTIRSIEDKHIVNDLNGTLLYRLSGIGKEKPFNYHLYAGAKFQNYSANHYPLNLYGFFDVTTVELWTGYKHYFNLPWFQFDPSFNLSLRQAIADDYSVTPQTRFNPLIPQMNHLYVATDYYMGELNLRFSKALNMSTIKETFLNINSVYLYMPNNEISNENYNIVVQASLGIIF